MKRLTVRHSGGSYDIHIADGALEQAGDLIPAPSGGRTQLIVTDESVAPLFLGQLEKALDRPARTIVLPAGEGTKNWTQLERLVEAFLTGGVERGDSVIALGGGVIGDLVGFAASVTRRGCGVVQIPTTLLAQVDSSVGGKTAINAAAGKNLVGAFHPPSFVLIDPDMLTTLPPRELGAGYAEVVKYGLLGDATFFSWCEQRGDALLSGDPAALEQAIAHCCQMKADIVAADERETSGQRALLNLGHTFGHAIEAECGFDGSLLHGEGVAIGMVLAARYSARLGLLSDGDAARIAAHLDHSGLPVRIPQEAADPARLVAHMRQDKKASGGAVPLILMRAIGEAFVRPGTDLADVESFLAEELTREPAL